MIVSAIVAVNAVGDIIDPASGKVVAGVRNRDGTFADARTMLRGGAPVAAPRAGENTTIAVVAPTRGSPKRRPAASRSWPTTVSRARSRRHTRRGWRHGVRACHGNLGRRRRNDDDRRARRRRARRSDRSRRHAGGQPRRACLGAPDWKYSGSVQVVLCRFISDFSLAYSVALIAIGLDCRAARARHADFFVAGRRLNAPLVFATVLASNIGAGATIGATGLGYREGLSAWWWSGSAAIGSIFLALFVGPRLWRIAAERNLYTAGDYLEASIRPTVRAIVASLIWLATLSILAGQLIAGAAV